VSTVSSPLRDECSAFRPSASDDAFDVGFSVPHQRTLVSQHERPDYTSRAAQSHVSEQSEQFSGVVGLIVEKLHPPFSALPRFLDSLAMISQIITIP
jgi:hypothetical protein